MLCAVLPAGAFLCTQWKVFVRVMGWGVMVGVGGAVVGGW